MKKAGNKLKLVLHFDVTNTILLEDTTKGLTKD